MIVRKNVNKKAALRGFFLYLILAIAKQ